MRAISVPRLQSLSLYLVRPQDQQRHYTHEVLEEVHAQYSTNIRSLEIDYEEVQYFDGQSEASEVLMSMIRPLLSMSHLEDVNIKLHGRSLSFRSTDLLLLAQRWPHIASLTIRFDPVGKSESPALKDVVEFSRMCPTLHTLILSHVTPDPPCTTEGGISISCTLPCLVVIDFESLTDTLQTLVNSFPKLDTEKCIQKANSLPVRGSWLDVLDSLSRLRENP
ncbi:hypothetical protein CERSUDRAFT_117002 [Gelatoporia subvermispora B]|uniref:F-box domain-containing protein n=1 Tax=Ceriporiopsis subvermispora (strain B) TaxID=914234 RepID=M2PFU8_CERS8|nr:hypothetical protein CERSUDRAFT_117002 [Gelatoporia subvermispora B]